MRRTDQTEIVAELRATIAAQNAALLELSASCARWRLIALATIKRPGMETR